MPPGSLFALRCVPSRILHFSIPNRPVILGRSTACDLVVKAASISRQHAKISPVDGAVEIDDLNSRHGTFIGNRRLGTDRMYLGETVRFGKIEFVLSLPEPEKDDETAEDLGGEEQRDPPNSADLSKAQLRVFQLLLQGHAEKMIAKRLHLSAHTVHNHTRVIFKTFTVHSRAQLLARFAYFQEEKSERL